MYSILLSSILRGVWAIEPTFAVNAVSTFIPELFKGKLLLESDSRQYDPVIITKSAGTANTIKNIGKWTDLDNLPEGSVAVINIKGSLMKDDQECGPIGTSTLSAYFEKADNHKKIIGTILKIDSPGGTVDGTTDFANVIKNAKKPVIAFCDGLMASAALWIGSYADEIWANNEFAQIGSVGVLTSFYDSVTHNEKEGYKFHQIVSTYSPDKTKLYDEIRKGEYDNYRKIKLDPLALEFQKVIRENIINVKDHHLTGELYYAKDVIDVFVNKIGTFYEAVERVIELSKYNNKKHTTKNQKNISMKNKFPALSAVLGDIEIQTDGDINLNNDQLSIIEQSLKMKKSVDSDFKALTEEKNKALDDLKLSNEHKEKALMDLKNAEITIEDLRNKVPGAESANHGSKSEIFESSEDTITALENMSLAERLEWLEKQYK